MVYQREGAAAGSNGRQPDTPEATDAGQPPGPWIFSGPLTTAGMLFWFRFVPRSLEPDSLAGLFSFQK